MSFEINTMSGFQPEEMIASFGGLTTESMTRSGCIQDGNLFISDCI